MNHAATAALALVLSLATASAFAADAGKTLSPQQQRMKDCNVQAKGKHGDERRSFMSTCLKGGTSTAAAAKPAAAKSKAAAANAGKR
jgi:psiF repeat-containing protein